MATQKKTTPEAEARPAVAEPKPEAEKKAAEMKGKPLEKGMGEFYITGPAGVRHESVVYNPGSTIICSVETYKNCLQPYGMAEPIAVHKAKMKAKADIEKAVAEAEAAAEKEIEAAGKE